MLRMHVRDALQGAWTMEEYHEQLNLLFLNVLLAPPAKLDEPIESIHDKQLR